MNTLNGNLHTQILFYSRTGKTRAVAEAVCEIFGGSLCEIIDAKYRKGITGYVRSLFDVWLMRPTEISPACINTHDSRLLFIGTPLWADRLPPAMRTFFSTAELNNKRVILFFTCGFYRKHSLMYKYTTHVNTMGATVIGNFFLRTRGKSKTALKNETKMVLNQYKTTWLESIINWSK